MSSGKEEGASVDPRVERSRRIVRQAALEELGAVGWGGFTIESVAARAGVGKATIYRHWTDRLALIADALESFHEEIVPAIGEATPREQVSRLVRHVAEVIVDSTFSDCIPALIEGAERDARVREFHHRYSAQRRAELVAVIARGVAAGDFEPDVDPELAATAMLGAIFYRRLMTPTAFDPEEASALVARVLG